MDCKHYANTIDYKGLKLPVTEAVSTSTVWLQQPVLLGEKKDMDDIAKAVRKIVDNIGELAK